MFLWFGVSILASVVVSLFVMWMLGLGAPGSPGWKRDLARFRGFAGDRFERVWDDPRAREELASAVHKQFEVNVVLTDASHRIIEVLGGKCGKHAMSTPVLRAGVVLGHVQVCAERIKPWSAWRLIIPLATAGLVLWVASGLVSRRLSRPLSELARVAEDIGRGKLSSRVELGHHGRGEVGVLADVLNEMAARVEKQMDDQRALLATVSHEIRTPLARMRLLVELGREQGAPAGALDDIDKEVVVIDALVADLLASSRLDFSALTLAELDAAVLATEAVERAEVDPAILSVETDERRLEGDATLLGRAVTNLLENAKRHGGGPLSLRVARRDTFLTFEVEDAGPGLQPGDEGRIFEPFYQGGKARGEGPLGPRGVGLGLALVRRIAEAHGGTAYARNRAEGGALVGFEVKAVT